MSGQSNQPADDAAVEQEEEVLAETSTSEGTAGQEQEPDAQEGATEQDRSVDENDAEMTASDDSVSDPGDDAETESGIVLEADESSEDATDDIIIEDGTADDGGDADDSGSVAMDESGGGDLEFEDGTESSEDTSAEGLPEPSSDNEEAAETVVEDVAAEPASSEPADEAPAGYQQVVADQAADETDDAEGLPFTAERSVEPEVSGEIPQEISEREVQADDLVERPVEEGELPDPRSMDAAGEEAEDAENVTPFVNRDEAGEQPGLDDLEVERSADPEFDPVFEERVDESEPATDGQVEGTPIEAIEPDAQDESSTDDAIPEGHQSVDTMLATDEAEERSDMAAEEDGAQPRPAIDPELREMSPALGLEAQREIPIEVENDETPEPNQVEGVVQEDAIPDDEENEDPVELADSEPAEDFDSDDSRPVLADLTDDTPVPPDREIEGLDVFDLDAGDPPIPESAGTAGGDPAGRDVMDELIDAGISPDVAREAILNVSEGEVITGTTYDEESSRLTMSFSDGSTRSFIPQADGSYVDVSTWPNAEPGTMESSETWTNEDGEEVLGVNRTDEDGTTHRTIYYPDGTETTTTEHPDGTTQTTSTSTDGSSVTETEYPDGTVVQESDDGTTVTYHPDGSTTIEYADGSTEHYEAEDSGSDDSSSDSGDNSSDSDNSSDDSSSDGSDDEVEAESGDQENAESSGDPFGTDSSPEQRMAWQDQFADQINAFRSGQETSEVQPVPEPVAETGDGEPPQDDVSDPPDEGEQDLPDEIEHDPVPPDEGNIDFGPDHIEEQDDTQQADPRLFEDKSQETGDGTSSDESAVTDAIDFTPGLITGQDAYEQVDDVQSGEAQQEVVDAMMSSDDTSEDDSALRSFDTMWDFDDPLVPLRDELDVEDEDDGLDDDIS